MSGGPTYTSANNAFNPGIPANRSIALNPRTTPMARPMPGRPMTDSQGRVIGGGAMPQNRFMPGPMGPGMTPGRQPGGPQIGFGMPPGGQPGTIPGALNPLFDTSKQILGTIDGNSQTDGAPTDVPNGMNNRAAPSPGQIDFGMPGGKSSSPGGKAYSGPQLTPFQRQAILDNDKLNASAPKTIQPGGAGQGTPFQSGAQFQQNT